MSYLIGEVKYLIGEFRSKFNLVEVKYLIREFRSKFNLVEVKYLIQGILFNCLNKNGALLKSRKSINFYSFMNFGLHHITNVIFSSFNPLKIRYFIFERNIIKKSNIFEY